MKLAPPFPLSTITQHFGDNAVDLYTQGLGLKGHPGIDFGAPWGTPIPAVVNAYCYSVILNSNPAFYQAIYTLYDDTEFSYEISYGHCSTITATAGMVIQGSILAAVGNSGSVFAGGVEVSTADKLAGSHAGAHLHFQVRKLLKIPVAQMDVSKPHINDGQGLYTSPDGFVYEIIDYYNGYNGCIDPVPFFDVSPFSFTKNLWLGMTNTDIKILQQRLSVSPQSGFFGPLTLAAVIRYQKAHGLPPTGFVGPQTRALLNNS